MSVIHELSCDKRKTLHMKFEEDKTYHISFYDDNYPALKIWINVFCHRKGTKSAVVQSKGITCSECGMWYNDDLLYNDGSGDYFHEMHNYDESNVIRRNNAIFYTKDRNEALTFIRSLGYKHAYKYLKRRNKFDECIVKK